MERLGHVLLPALPEEFPRLQRHGSSTDSDCGGSAGRGGRGAGGGRGGGGGRGAAGAPSEAQTQYAAWHRKRLLELYNLWEGEIRKVNPEAAFFPNGFDQIRESISVPILFADRQNRSPALPPWQNGKSAKDARSTFGMKPIVGLFGVTVGSPYRWMDSVQNPNEVRVFAVDGIAQGFRPWVIKFNAKPLDQRWLKPVEDLFAWHWKNEKYMRNERPLARVGLVSSARGSADHNTGFYHALVEARIPFETVPDTQLDPAHVQQFKVLALPNIVNLSDAQCAQLKAFVEKGGGLVATHETSLNDERGRRRADFGLADLFGASFAGNVIERQQNAYLNLEDRSHPILEGMTDVGRLVHGAMRVEIRVPAGLRAPLMTVPTYPDLPMEEVYQREYKTDIPGVMVRNVGSGRVAYFPWDIDRTFWEIMNQDQGIVLTNAVRWARHVVDHIGHGRARRHRVARLCGEDLHPRARGDEVVLVCSGAIASGLPALGFRPGPPTWVCSKPSPPSGSPCSWHGSARSSGSTAARGAGVAHPARLWCANAYLHARDTLRRLLDLGVVPVVNENDTVADDEIRYGDNDRLAALVSHLVHADVLVLLTDTAGLFTADPRLDERRVPDRGDRRGRRCPGGRRRRHRHRAREWWDGEQAGGGQDRGVVRGTRGDRGC